MLSKKTINKQDTLVSIFDCAKKQTLIRQLITPLLFVIMLGVLPFLTSNLSAQPKTKNYGHSNTLLFPINPGTPNTLAGSMGELRSSHFHTGIDIRTGGQEGLAVLAADDGYLSRAKIKPGGYGNTLYIKHPNGHTTVYAHLKSFNAPIAAYVRKQQYDRKTFSIDLYLDKEAFPVMRGDTIALSGNSGSSGGPHLHFDVRNHSQDLLNPLHYGFKEITDKRPPVAKELAIVSSNIKSRVNAEYGRITIPFENEGNKYFIRDTLYAKGRIGLELLAYDKMTNTRFKTGVNKIKIKVNNSLHLVTNIDTWSFAKSRQFYTYVNYQALANNRKRFHKLYIDKGNRLNFYSTTLDNGFLTINDGKTYNIEITLSDSYQNESTVYFTLKGGNKVGNSYKNTAIPTSNWRINKEILILKTKTEDTLLIYSKGKAISIKSLFKKKEYSIYVRDLKEGIIDSISINGIYESLNIKAYVPTGIAYNLYNPIADIQFSKNTLFSDLFVTLSSKTDTITGFEIVSIGKPNVPLNKSFTVQYKPTSPPLAKKYWRIYSVWKKNAAYIGGKWNGNQISFTTRSFGNYTLKADSIPPKIKPVIINKDELVFKITDDLSGINSIAIHVNNQWILMNYDPKKSLIWAEKPNSDFNYKGKIELNITDNIGNESTYLTEIN